MKYANWVCFKKGCLMRDKEYFKEQMQKHRFNNRLTQIRQTRTLCVYCDKPAETLHHINEDQSDNRLKNLLPVCQEHHLNIPHDCDITFTDRFKSLKMPLKPVNSLKNAEYYLNSTVNTLINDITIIKSNSYLKIYIETISQRAFRVLVNLGYSEILEK